MKLTVTDPTGALVAEVDVDLDPASTFAHVVGAFTPGPGFDRIKLMLDDFERVYATGDLERASASHETIDQLGLIATRPDGVRYAVFNIYLQKGALLFAVSKAPPESSRWS